MIFLINNNLGSLSVRYIYSLEAWNNLSYAICLLRNSTYDNNTFENAEYSNSDVLKLERKLDRANY